MSKYSSLYIYRKRSQLMNITPEALQLRSNQLLFITENRPELTAQAKDQLCALNQVKEIIGNSQDVEATLDEFIAKNGEEGYELLKKAGITSSLELLDFSNQSLANQTWELTSTNNLNDGSEKLDEKSIKDNKKGLKGFLMNLIESNNPVVSYLMNTRGPLGDLIENTTGIKIAQTNAEMIALFMPKNNNSGIAISTPEETLELT